MIGTKKGSVVPEGQPARKGSRRRQASALRSLSFDGDNDNLPRLEVVDCDLTAIRNS